MALSTGLSAAPSFQLGNNPEPDEQNLLFGSSQTGTSINGFTNQTNTQAVITSTQTLTTTGIGQASIQPTSGVFTNFAVTLPGTTFRDIIFNPQIGGQPNAPGGAATVTVVGSEGTFNFNYTLDNGNNFLTIVAAAGETLSSVSFSTAGGFNDLRQIRLSGVSGGGTVPVPEPMTLSLFGLGLAGLGVALRRRAPQS